MSLVSRRLLVVFCAATTLVNCKSTNSNSSVRDAETPGVEDNLKHVAEAGEIAHVSTHILDHVLEGAHIEGATGPLLAIGTAIGALNLALAADRFTEVQTQVNNAVSNTLRSLTLLDSVATALDGYSCGGASCKDLINEFSTGWKRQFQSFQCDFVNPGEITTLNAFMAATIGVDLHGHSLIEDANNCTEKCLERYGALQAQYKNALVGLIGAIASPVRSGSENLPSGTDCSCIAQCYVEDTNHHEETFTAGFYYYRGNSDGCLVPTITGEAEQKCRDAISADASAPDTVPGLDLSQYSYKSSTCRYTRRTVAPAATPPPLNPAFVDPNDVRANPEWYDSHFPQLRQQHPDWFEPKDD